MPARSVRPVSGAPKRGDGEPPTIDRETAERIVSVLLADLEINPCLGEGDNYDGLYDPARVARLRAGWIDIVQRAGHPPARGAPRGKRRR